MDYFQRYRPVIVKSNRVMIAPNDYRDLFDDFIKQWDSGKVCCSNLIDTVILYDTANSDFVTLIL